MSIGVLNLPGTNVGQRISGFFAGSVGFGRRRRGASILSRATHHWDPTTYQGNGPWVDKIGGLVAQKGAAGQAAIIADGLWLPAVGANYASYPYSLTTVTTSVALTVTGVWGDADANASFLGSQDANSGFNVFQEADQDIRVHFYDATTSLVSGSANLTAATHGFSTGDPFAMRFTVDVAAEELVVEHGPSLASMTAESAVTLSTISGGGLFDGAASALVVGMRGTGSTYPGVGTVGTASFSFDGTVVASPDFATETPGALTHTDAQANVWTVTQTADGSDDPTMEPTPATGHVSFSGISGNYLQADAPVVVVGDLIVAVVVNPSATTGSFQTLVGCRNGTDGYTLAFIATGELRLTWRDSGGALHNVDSTVVVSAGEHAWGATLDLDDGAGNHVVSFTEDGAALGAAVSNVGATSIKAPTSDLTIGAHPAGTADLLAGGLVKSATVHDGTTLVADLNIERDFDGDQNVITSTATGEAWSVSRSTTAVGYRTSIIAAAKPRFGGAQFLQIDPPSFLGSQDCTIVVPFRVHSTPAATSFLIAADNAGSSLLDLFHLSSGTLSARLRNTAGTVTEQVSVSQATLDTLDGALHVAVIRRTYGVRFSLVVNSSGTEDFTDDLAGDLSLSRFKFMSNPAGTGNFSNGEDVAPLFYDSVLTDDEANALCTQLGAGT